MTLIEALIEAGYPREEMYHHGMDLYIFVTPITKRVVWEWYKEKGYSLHWNCPIFTDQVTGRLMYDCAFQYYEEEEKERQGKMDRYTKRTDKGIYCSFDKEGKTAAEKLAEYEDLEEQGLLLRLPVPIGGTFWRIMEKPNRYKTKRYKYIEQGTLTWQNLQTVIRNFNKTLFCTREEAAQELRKMGE